MRDVKAVIFDAGGTLVEGRMPWFQIYHQALELTGHALPMSRMVQCYEAAIRRMMADKRTAVGPEVVQAPQLNDYLAAEFGLSPRRLRHAVDEVLFDHPEAKHLVCADGVQSMLTALETRGYRLAVLSNWSVDLPTVLAQLGLRQHFEAVFASESLGCAKPDPAAFLMPLDRMGLTPGTAAYVGDLYDVDILGAREVGMPAVLVDPLRLGLHDDVPTVGHLSELLELFPGP